MGRRVVMIIAHTLKRWGIQLRKVQILYTQMCRFTGHLGCRHRGWLPLLLALPCVLGLHTVAEASIGRASPRFKEAEGRFAPSVGGG